MKVNSIQFQLVSALTFTIAFSITNLFSQKPNFVRPASVNDLKIQYISFTVQTANLEDAGTGRLCIYTIKRQHEAIYLNKSGDDFEKEINWIFTYFADPAIKTVRDIKYLKIGKSGSDGWALKRFRWILMVLLFMVRLSPIFGLTIRLEKKVLQNLYPEQHLMVHFRWHIADCPIFIEK